LLDEADFFPRGQQADARDVSERHIAKSNPYIVMVSTPNAPDGLFERIKKRLKIPVCVKGYFLIILMVLAKYIPKKKSRKPNNHLHLSENIT
jgi:hypothetical protein